MSLQFIPIPFPFIYGIVTGIVLFFYVAFRIMWCVLFCEKDVSKRRNIDVEDPEPPPSYDEATNTRESAPPTYAQAQLMSKSDDQCMIQKCWNLYDAKANKQMWKYPQKIDDFNKIEKLHDFQPQVYGSIKMQYAHSKTCKSAKL